MPTPRLASVLLRLTLRLVVTVVVVLAVLVSALAFDTANGDAASTAPCALRQSYSGLTVSCYGAPGVPVRGVGQQITVPARAASDGRAHLAVVTTRTPTVVSLQLDVNGRAGDVVCAAAWGFACRYTYR